MIFYALDFETSSNNKYAAEIDRVVVSPFDIDTGEIHDTWDYCFREGHIGSNIALPSLSGLMADDRPKVMHNATYDLFLMEYRIRRSQLGIPVNGPIYDTYLMAKHWRNDLPAYDLKTLSYLLFGDLYGPLRKLRKWIYEKGLKESENPDMPFDMTVPPDGLVHDYCAHDVKATARLAHFLWPHVKDNYAFQLDTELIRPLMEMEAKGITVDKDHLKRVMALGKRRIRRNKRNAKTALDTDGSPAGNALRGHLEGLGESRRTATGMVQSDEAVLKDHQGDDVVDKVRRIRSDQKLVNTYASNILTACGGRDRFHPGLIQSGAVTRRFRAASMYGDDGTVAKGQVMNIPRRKGTSIRQGFIVPKGYWCVKLDLASIEARLGAHAMSVFLGEDWFCQQYRKSDKFNIYQHVVQVCTGQKVTKKENIYEAYKHGCLGTQYGVGVTTFHKTLVDKFDLPYTQAECSAIYASIRKRFPQFGRLQRFVSRLIETQGYVMDDFGSVYYVSANERYKGVSYYCQGCAANVFRWWWIKVHGMMEDMGDYVWNTLYDELDTAIKKDRGSRKRIKEYCDVLDELTLFNLPIVAESSGLKKNWGQCG